MTMSARLRKVALTAHVSAALGWIGAVVAYLALVLTAMNRPDDQTLRAAWIAMELIAGHRGRVDQLRQVQRLPKARAVW